MSRPGEAIGIAVAVDALVRRAHDRRGAVEHGRRAEDRLARQRVPAHDVPLRLVQRPRLVQDRARDHHLADVVQVGRERDVVDRLGRDRELGGDRARELGHPVAVRTQVGGVLVDDREQEVARLALGRDAVVVLLRVHALVDDPQRRRRVAGLARQQGEPAR